MGTDTELQGHSGSRISTWHPQDARESPRTDRYSLTGQIHLSAIAFLSVPRLRPLMDPDSNALGPTRLPERASLHPTPCI